MTKITVLNNQSLLDVAIRHCGTIEAIADIALLNGISITRELVPGQILNIPFRDYGNQEVINFFVNNKMDPATSLTQENIDLIENNSGIGYWVIENDNIVQ
ncbi:hypothetical protein [Flavobacterium sp. B183]|uniref:hypothetical protein n=1 Tax=Flavobacterium sp. B183 TaxID=907046 RepID=UPI00201EEC54|nr:hypothetical protein [Flavobacterium sp. B183]URC13939.1 hypothetical protein M4I44_05955 [Flavobacterium sp. B183]URC14039.1 hypothetical protein M4I44_06525 [Flavobacterium sp. B183]